MSRQDGWIDINKMGEERGGGEKEGQGAESQEVKKENPYADSAKKDMS